MLPPTPKLECELRHLSEYDCLPVRTSLNRPGAAAHATAALDAARTPDSEIEPRPMSAPAAKASVTSAVAIHASILRALKWNAGLNA